MGAEPEWHQRTSLPWSRSLQAARPETEVPRTDCLEPKAAAVNLAEETRELSIVTQRACGLRVTITFSIRVSAASE